MTRPQARRRGEPLVMLVLLLTGWAGARLLLWETPSLPGGGQVLAGEAISIAAQRPVSSFAAVPTGESGDEASRPHGTAVAPQIFREPLWGTAPAPAWQPEARAPGLAHQEATSGADVPLASPGLAGGHQIMYLAALARLPLPSMFAAATAQPQASTSLPLVRAPALPSTMPGDSAPPPLLAAARSRWSADAWLLWRKGDSLASAAGQPSYGGSQAGSVVRFALAPSSSRSPQAYARVSRALAFQEGEAAVGLAVKPVPAAPLRLLAEGRVQRSGGATRLRPAASVVTELPPQRLPLGAEAEIYAQAGYVGGADATPFFDAQLTAERPAAQFGAGELRLGGGLWAGGQSGAARVDVGPRASLRLGLGEAGATRLAVDWRVRVAGDAAPDTGPALTLSAGF